MTSTEIANLIQTYNIDDLLTFKELTSGMENTNYLLTTRNSKYVLRVYNKVHSFKGVRTLNSIQLEHDFIALCSPNIPVSLPIQNKKGKTYTTVPGVGIISLFTFVNGMVSDTVTTEIVKTYSVLVSELYSISSKFKTQPAEMTYDPITRLKSSFHSYTEKDTDVDSLIEKLYSQVAENLEELKKLAKGYVHGDIKLSNTLLHENVLSGLLDFDDMRYSFLLEETVMTLMHNIAEPAKNIIRSGLYEDFVNNITNRQLIQEINNYLKLMLRARLAYDLIKFSAKNINVATEIVNDTYVQKYILQD